MIKLQIDEKHIEVDPGTTILNAAKAAGKDIPTMCFSEDFGRHTSCMICVVQVEGKPFLVPSCSGVVEEGMVVETDNDRIREARTSAVELLLSEHAGDCIAPCQKVCPYHLDIPEMIRLVQKGDLDAAAALLEKAYPTAGPECNRQCERACRRRSIDEPVGICDLVRFLRSERGASGKKEQTEPASPSFNSILKKITEEEYDVFLDGASKEKRVVPGNAAGGYTKEEAHRESMRCLHCDCRKKDECKLREYADRFEAKQSRFAGERLSFSQKTFGDYVFEPGKCIKCGICTRMSEQLNVRYGFTFTHRGFEGRVGVAFDRYEHPALLGAMNDIVKHCPTGALAFKENKK